MYRQKLNRKKFALTTKYITRKKYKSANCKKKLTICFSRLERRVYSTFFSALFLFVLLAHWFSTHFSDLSVKQTKVNKINKNRQ